MNGSTDNSEPKSESNDEEEEKKPKIREWEKNKAPWVAELKQNQAKRTSVGPTSTPVSTTERVKLTPTGDKIPDIQEEAKKPHENDSSPTDMSKSMSILSKKTPDNEFVVLRNKTASQPISISPVRPQSIHSSSSPLESTKISPIAPSHTPISKPPIADKTNVEAKTASPRTSLDKKSEAVSIKQYLELVDRVTHMENRMQQRLQEMQGQIDELQAKLKVESDLRIRIQDDLEKVTQCVTQV